MGGESGCSGFPGDGIGEFDGALGAASREGDGLDYIRPTHEEICSLMATAHAKFTGEIGVCIATSSPGAFHMLNGLYDAKSDNQPVVAIVGQQATSSLGTFEQAAGQPRAHHGGRRGLRADDRDAAAGAGRGRHRVPNRTGTPGPAVIVLAARRAGNGHA